MSGPSDESNENPTIREYIENTLNLSVDRILAQAELLQVFPKDFLDKEIASQIIQHMDNEATEQLKTHLIYLNTTISEICANHEKAFLLYQYFKTRNEGESTEKIAKLFHKFLKIDGFFSFDLYSENLLFRMEMIATLSGSFALSSDVKKEITSNDLFFSLCDKLLFDNLSDAQIILSISDLEDLEDFKDPRRQAIRFIMRDLTGSSFTEYRHNGEISRYTLFGEVTAEIIESYMTLLASNENIQLNADSFLLKTLGLTQQLHTENRSVTDISINDYLTLKTGESSNVIINEFFSYMLHRYKTLHHYRIDEQYDNQINLIKEIIKATANNLAITNEIQEKIKEVVNIIKRNNSYKISEKLNEALEPLLLTDSDTNNTLDNNNSDHADPQNFFQSTFGDSVFVPELEIPSSDTSILPNNLPYSDKIYPNPITIVEPIEIEQPDRLAEFGDIVDEHILSDYKLNTDSNHHHALKTSGSYAALNSNQEVFFYLDGLNTFIATDQSGGLTVSTLRKSVFNPTQDNNNDSDVPGDDVDHPTHTIEELEPIPVPVEREFVYNFTVYDYVENQIFHSVRTTAKFFQFVTPILIAAHRDMVWQQQNSTWNKILGNVDRALNSPIYAEYYADVTLEGAHPEIGPVPLYVSGINIPLNPGKPKLPSIGTVKLPSIRPPVMVRPAFAFGW